jgi:hypothetical protein
MSSNSQNNFNTTDQYDSGNHHDGGDTTGTTARSAEQAYDPGVTGADSGNDNQYGRPDEGVKGKIVEKAERAFGGNTATDSGNDNQYGRSSEGNGDQPSTKDKVLEKAQRAFGANTTTDSGTNGHSDHPSGGQGVVPDSLVAKAERASGGNATTGSGTDNQYGLSSQDNSDEPKTKDKHVGKDSEERGSGTDNQYGRSSENNPPWGGYQGEEVSGVKPSIKDKIIGKAERAYGKAERVVDNLRDKI